MLAGRRIVKPAGWRTTQDLASGGAWRTQRPILDVAKCTGCLICWKFCPEPAIVRLDGKVAIRLQECKGCGICATECPVEAIAMQAEVV